MTASERTLWDALRRDLDSYKFRRQHPIGDYIADFLCLRLKLVIEVDGAYHSEPQQQQEDLWRTEFLQDKDYKVIRFTNEEVDTDVKNVIRRIKEEITNIEDSYE